MLSSSVSLRKLEAWERRKSRRTTAYHILVLIYFLGESENGLLLSLLKNGSFQIDPFVFWRFYKVLFESKLLLWTYQNKLAGCPKPANLSFRNTKSFQPPMQKTAFSATKVEVTKPDLRRIYLHTAPDQTFGN